MWRWRRQRAIRSQGVPSWWTRASCPPPPAAQHPPLLHGIFTSPPTPPSLTRLPVVRALSLRALFFAAAAPSTAAGARRVSARACARSLTRFVGPFWGDNPLPPSPVSRGCLPFPLPPPLLLWPRLPRQCALGGRPRCQREALVDAFGARALSVRQPVVWCCGRRPRAGGVRGGRAPAVWAAAARRRCGRRPRAGGVGGCRWSLVWEAAAGWWCGRLLLVGSVGGCHPSAVWAAAAHWLCGRLP